MVDGEGVDGVAGLLGDDQVAAVGREGDLGRAPGAPADSGWLYRQWKAD